MRAARYGFPLTLAIIGGSAKRFLPYVELYKRSLKEMGKPDAAHRRALARARRRNGSSRRKKKCGRTISSMMNRIGRERGWPPRGRDDFEREAGPDGAMYVGAPKP